MSFLKITDPSKRDFIVEEFLKSKKNIKRNFLSERLGDIGLQRELTKMYKPIVDSQSTISKEQKALLSTIKESSAETSNALKALPASISALLKTLDTVAGFFNKLFVSNAANQIASAALSAGKDAAKEIGKKAFDVGKTVVIDAGND